MNVFADRLGQLRARQDQPLATVSAAVGIPPSRLVELENGVRLPTDGQLQRLEAFYKLEAGELARLAEKIEPGQQW